MVGLIKRKLEASTLIEVLIAMVIIVIVFTIAMHVFANVMNTGVSSAKIKAENQIRLIAADVKNKGQIDEEVLILDSIGYELRVMPAVAAGLSQLEISAIQEGRKITMYRCWFVDKLNEEN
ncbi:type II secretion system protein [Pedobacter sp.]